MAERTGGTPSVRPTKKQQELLQFIQSFIDEHGYSPSYREIMNGCQYSSVATVALHVGNLIKRGHIRKRDRSARSLEIVPAEELTVPAVQSRGDPAITDAAAAQAGRWLEQQAEALFAAAETEPVPDDRRRAELEMLVHSFELLGFNQIAARMQVRLEALAA